MGNVEVFFQIWCVYAKRTLTQPEELVVRIVKETEYLVRSRNCSKVSLFLSNTSFPVSFCKSQTCTCTAV